MTRKATSGSKAASQKPTPSKGDQVQALLRRPQGATLPELMSVTGWLAHSARAELTRIRKRHTVEKKLRDGILFYRISGDGH